MFLFIFDCFSPFPNLLFAVICHLSTLQQTVASSHELMKLLQQLLPPVQLGSRTFRKRFLNNFPGGCLTNFTGAVSLSSSSSILHLSAFIRATCSFGSPCLACWRANKKRAVRSQRRRWLRFISFPPLVNCIYTSNPVLVYLYKLIYIYIYILISELILRLYFPLLGK